ncbi:MAG: penicillin-binding protein, partial [Bacteroidota bacterium]
MKLNKSLLKQIMLHLSLMAAVAISLLFLFFQFILPAMTHHGELMIVPSLTGVSLEEADTIL